MRRFSLGLALSLAAGYAVAGDVTVDIRDGSGRPVRDAVVMIRPAGGIRATAPMKVSWPMVMAQRDIQFTPYVLVVPQGSTVSFPNKDKVRHHVYSFSAAKTFELKLYGKDESRTVLFDKPGAISLGCNIHDGMIAYVYVTDTPFAAKSGADGAATIQDAPAGASQLVVWHPALKSKAPASRALAVTAAAQRASIVLDLRAANPR